MKKSAARTLGIAALGTAFAASGAGAAHAVPGVPEVAGVPLGSVLGTVSQTLPAPAQHSAEQTPARGKGAPAAQQSPGNGGPAAQANRLLGGLPLKGLPTRGLGLNGLPVG